MIQEKIMEFSREAFERDKAWYEQTLQNLLAEGLPDDHPLVELQRRRIETVERVLNRPDLWPDHGDGA